MENAGLYPFEKNRYYLGKLLTSGDFQAEQDYINNKRRFVNKFAVGSGVLCGMSVFNLDDTTVMIESGACIDEIGREIILDSSIVRKLSAINGFADIKTSLATLCIKYNEEPVSPVYAPGTREGKNEYEPNRILESFTLFLKEPEASAPIPSTAFLNTITLYSDADFCITACIPCVASCLQPVCFTLEIIKKSDEERSLSIDAVLQIPAFLSAENEHEFKIEAESLNLKKGKRKAIQSWLTACAEPVADTAVIARAELFKLKIGDEDKTINSNQMLKTAVSSLSVEQLVDKAVCQPSLEEKTILKTKDYVELANFKLVQVQNAYVIEQVIEDGVKQYICSAADSCSRREYLSYFTPQEGFYRHQENTLTQPQAFAQTLNQSSTNKYATGVLEIPLSTSVRKGDIVYSDEILHGLGQGNIFVSLGVEYLDEDNRTKTMEKDTIYGNAELFADEKPPISFVQTAVKVFANKGSFVAAARLMRNTPYVVLMLRWVAVKISSHDDSGRLTDISGKSISAAMQTIILETGESRYIGIRFKNMEPCSVVYELVDDDSGDITPDGIYTAPLREGVFEIRIHCADMPMIVTYAYAIVKKKTVLEKQIK